MKYETEAAEATEATEAAPGPDWKEVTRTWLASIDYSEKTQKDFVKKGRKITKRYRADLAQSSSARAGSRFNMFWSNVQTLGPATYSRRPKVEVSRRFRDSDPVGRLAGQILERALQFEVDRGLNFHNTLKNVVLDRLLPGRGTAWVRYEPAFKKEVQQVPVEGSLDLTEQEVEVIADETTPVDYVFWENFLTAPAQTWADVTWVGRIVPFTKEALKKRFADTTAKLGGNVEDIPADHDPSAPTRDEDSSKSRDEGVSDDLKRALVYELWDKTRKQIVFVCKGYQFPLDIVDDPADLDDFFPCPKPLTATTTNDELLPVADFLLYQDQLRELDTLTTRIALLQSALRVIGVYDSAQDSLKNLLQSGAENRMVPVSAWAAFAEKGGLKGVMDFVPIEQIVAVLEGLYKAREICKQTIYEITGMADIIRGASVASETLGAQQIKAKFANLRLADRQQGVAEFATGVLQLKAQLMCRHYTPETFLRVASVAQIEEAQLHPERVGEALKLLTDDRIRSYRIEVQAGSMVELDEVDEQKRRNEFLSMTANFFLAMKNIAGVAPEMMTVALEMLKFSVRGFPVGRGLEASIEDASEGIKKRMAQPQPPQPDPTEMAKLAAAKEIEGMKQQGETQRQQMSDANKQAIVKLEGQVEAFLTEANQKHEMMTGELEETRTQASSAQDATRAFGEREHQRQIEAESAQQTAATEMAQQAQETTEMDKAATDALARLEASNTEILSALQKLILEVGKPRRKTPTYDPKTGDISHVDDAVVQH